MGPIVVALGGNAISPRGEVDTIENQFDHSMSTARKLVHLVQDGWDKIVVTHGNGPQVGNVLKRVELAKDVAPWLPLYICVADTQGGMGLMIQQCLDNALSEQGLQRPVVSLVTQVMVAADDPGFDNPTKPIGPERRLVASPEPLRVVELASIETLLRAGAIVVAAGGGGVPVVETADGWRGVEAVIDKDLTASLLAISLDAEILVILTDVEGVMIDSQVLGDISVSDLEDLSAAGRFPSGSMGPKVTAAIRAVRAGVRRAVVAHLDRLEEAIAGRAGTQVTSG